MARAKAAVLESRKTALMRAGAGLCLLAAAALVFAAPARAQDAPISPASEPTALSTTLPSTTLPSTTLPPAAVDMPTAIEVGDTPWYETFSLSSGDRPTMALNDVNTIDWESAGGGWGITLGIEENPTQPFEYEDLSASAFFNVGERFRFGTQLRWTAPEDLVIGAEPEARAPEVKFESALRF